MNSLNGAEEALIADEGKEFQRLWKPPNSTGLLNDEISKAKLLTSNETITGEQLVLNP
jgi:hypothetical protein